MTDPDASAKPHSAAPSGDRAGSAVGVRTPIAPEQLARLRLDAHAVRVLAREASRRALPPATSGWTVAALAEAYGDRELDHLLRELPSPSPCALRSAVVGHAAAELARQTGIMSADEAYVLGLLHDPWADPTQLAELPVPMRAQLEAATRAPREDQVLALDECLLPAAALLADLSGLPGTPAVRGEPHPSVQAFALRSAAVGAHELRSALVADVLEAGLDPAAMAEFVRATGPDAAVVDQPDPTTLTLRLLRGGEGLRSGQRLADWCCRTAVAELGHDRATFVHWIECGTRIVVRSSSTAEDHGVRRTTIELTPGELETLRKAADTGCAVRLGSDAVPPAGLLGWLDAREALIAPVARKGTSPSFLVVDRTATARRLPDPARDALLSVLAEATSIRLENLLLERRSRRSAQSALVDPLTRLWNRRFGMASLNQSIAQAKRAGTALTVLMIDIDQFKKLNDTYGHARGDIALRATADVLRTTLRRSDTICRFGGEEFLVVLVETLPEEAAMLAARLFMEIEARGHAVQLPLTASIGQASLRPADTADSLLLRADRALYASKSQGRNRFSIDADDL